MSPFTLGWNGDDAALFTLGWIADTVIVLVETDQSAATIRIPYGLKKDDDREIIPILIAFLNFYNSDL